MCYLAQSHISFVIPSAGVPSSAWPVSGCHLLILFAVRLASLAPRRLNQLSEPLEGRYTPCKCWLSLYLYKRITHPPGVYLVLPYHFISVQDKLWGNRIYSVLFSLQSCIKIHCIWHKSSYKLKGFMTRLSEYLERGFNRWNYQGCVEQNNCENKQRVGEKNKRQKGHQSWANTVFSIINESQGIMNMQYTWCNDVQIWRITEAALTRSIRQSH